MSQVGLLFHKYREHHIMYQADQLICVTEGICRQLETKYNVDHNRCVVIPNATDTSIFFPRNHVESAKEVGIELTRDDKEKLVVILDKIIEDYIKTQNNPAYNSGS